MNVFFELSESFAKMRGNKYFAVYGVSAAAIPDMHLRLMFQSTRVWGERQYCVSKK